jgi:hypothetical protein
MANPTTNYGFVLPTSSDLVTDLPADFDVALQGVDTRLKALQPGTTLGDLAYSSATANTNTRLGIGTTGQVLTVSGGVPTWSTIATGPTFTGVGVYKGTNQSISNNTSTAVSFASEYFDTNAFHDNSTNNSRLTIPAGKAGKYQINYNVNWDANGTGSRQAIVYLNNATVISLVETDNAGASRGIGIGGSLIYSLAEADYIQVLVFQNSGGALDCLSGGNPTTFSISYLGA